MKFLGIIPARYQSTRFPGKPLAMLGDKPIIEWVYRSVSHCFDDLCVATDDDRIAAAVRSFGGKAVMTSSDCKSGTDRCSEVLGQIQGDFDVVVNVQGDEPFIRPQQIETLKGCFAHPDTQIATLVKKFDPAAGWQALSNPNTPKVALAADGHALYFSRSVIPYLRGKEPQEWLATHTFYKHIGIYAYRAQVLRSITRLPQSPLELAESLEQLRWIENGYPIRAAVTEYETVGIDTPADLEAARKLIGQTE